MRIYLPATLDELDAATATREAALWTVAPRPAHAVTSLLVRELADEDDEGREYAAALEAADDSLALIASRPQAPRQRVVVTVEVPDDAVELAGAGEGAASGGGPGPSEGAASGGGPGAGAGATGDRTDAQADDDVAASAVEVVRTVADIAIVCVHVDEPEAAADIEAVLAAADGDGPEADEALDAALERVTERDLLWYDWSELGDIPRTPSPK